jgi:HEAT repeat protein
MRRDGPGNPEPEDSMDAPAPKLPRSIPKLLRRLRSPDVAVRAHAALLLRELGAQAKPALPALIEALREEDAHLRRVAAWVLGHLGRAGLEVHGPLRGAQVDPDEGVRTVAAAALASMAPAPGPGRAA